MRASSKRNPADRILREVPLDARFHARLAVDAGGGAHVGLVDTQSGASWNIAPVRDRTRASLVAAVIQARDAMGRILIDLAVSAPVPPSMTMTTTPEAQSLPPGVPPQRGLDLRRREEFTDDGQLYLELSAFSGSKAWAAQLVKVPLDLTRRRDYDYQFLSTGDRSESRSGRTGHATYDLRSEPDGAYIAESVWRSGKPQRVYFRLEGGSVQETSEDVDTARAWLGLTTPLDEVVRAAQRAQADVARAAAGELRLPVLNGASDKQRDYAERVRDEFVQKFRQLPASARTLWRSLTVVTNAAWWLDNGNVRKTSMQTILSSLTRVWLKHDPVVAAEALGAGWALSVIEEAREEKLAAADALKYVLEKADRSRDMQRVEKIIRRLAPSDAKQLPLDEKVLASFSANAFVTLQPYLNELAAQVEPTSET